MNNQTITCPQCGKETEKPTEAPRVFPVDFLNEPDVKYIMSDVRTLRLGSQRVPMVLIRAREGQSG